MLRQCEWILQMQKPNPKHRQFCLYRIPCWEKRRPTVGSGGRAARLAGVPRLFHLNELDFLQCVKKVEMPQILKIRPYALRMWRQRGYPARYSHRFPLVQQQRRQH